jgi:SAM-dependent methyltransferase
MLMPERKEVVYDPARFLDIETVEEAVNIITTPTEGLTANERWEQETPALMSMFQKFIKNGDRVLDYGCGIGRLSKPLVKMLGCKVIGVDISANMRALATSMVDDNRFVAMHPDMFDYLLSNEITSFAFDSVISVWALQHCIDLENALSRIASSIINKGMFMLVNNITRCLPVEGGEWADDGLDIHRMIQDRGFLVIEKGVLDEKIAPGWMQTGTFWAAYQRT